MSNADFDLVLRIAGYCGAAIAVSVLIARSLPSGRGLGSSLIAGSGRPRWAELPLTAALGGWLAAGAHDEAVFAAVAASWVGPAALAPLFPFFGIRPRRLRISWTLLCIPALLVTTAILLPALESSRPLAMRVGLGISLATATGSFAVWILRAWRTAAERRAATFGEAVSLGVPICLALCSGLIAGLARAPVELLIPIVAIAAGRVAAARRSRWTRVQAGVVDSLGDGVLVIDTTGLVLAATKSARGLLSDLSIPDDGSPWTPPQSMRSALTDAETSDGNFSLLGPTGQSRHFEVRSSPMWQRGYPQGTRIATIREVTNERAMEERLQRLAYFDNLTGLPNRRRFIELLGERIRSAAERGAQLALLYLDLDGLKDINDAEGHGAGDELLREIAKRFRQLSAVRSPGDPGGGSGPRLTVGRLGGDEFAIMIEPVGGLEQAVQTAEALLDVAREPVGAEAGTLQASASIGIALYPDHAEDREELIYCADTALYRAKDQGRDRYAVFDQELAATIARRNQMSRELRSAIESGALEIYYQPKIDLGTNRTIGAEALLRWNNRDLGSVSPSEFVPLAESSQSIIPLGKWVLAETFRQMRAWSDEQRKLVPISINVSGVQLADRGFVTFFARAMQRFEIPPELVEIELTETAYLEENETTRHSLDEIRAMGIKTALDDFGTGYSSLAYLTRIPLDVLKLDRSLVRDLVTDPDARKILSAVGSLAHGLGLELVAEGIDDEGQVPILREAGCQIGQGFLYSPAIPAEAFTSMLDPVEADQDADLPQSSEIANRSEPLPEPYVLIVDDEANAPLGEVALELTRQGLLVLYTRFPDEAFLLAQQDPQAIGSVMIAPNTPSEPVRSALQCVRAGGSNPQIIVVGEKPEEARLAALRELGATWAAWHPFSMDTLVNLITMTLGLPEGGDRRSEPRLPVSIDASLAGSDGEGWLVKVCSLSANGAFVAMRAPAEVASEITLSFRLGGDGIELPARVLYSVGRRSAWQHQYARGIGVQFTELDADTKERLEAWTKSRLARFSV